MNVKYEEFNDLISTIYELLIHVNLFKNVICSIEGQSYERIVLSKI